MGKVYEQVLKFKEKHPMTIGWRPRQNASVVERHLNSDEVPLYSFIAQKNDNPFNIVGTAVVTLTSKRLLIGRKRVIFGYFLNAITPDMFNDLTVYSGLIWGKIKIDTQIYEAYARGKLKNEEITPLVGDKVEIEITDEENNTPLCNDVMSGVHIDWDGTIHRAYGKDVLNEIDVMTLHGNVLTFISCKSGNMDSGKALNAMYELETVARRFGGKYAKNMDDCSDNQSVCRSYRLSEESRRDSLA